MDKIKKIAFLIMLSMGLFLMVVGVGVMIFGEPIVMNFGGYWTPKDIEPVTVQYDFYLEFGWRIVIVGIIAIAAFFFIFLDDSPTSNQKPILVKRDL